MKKIILIIICSILIFSSCTIEPVLQNQNQDRICVEFPGGKYATFYSSKFFGVDEYFPRDEYDPLYHVMHYQPFYIEKGNSSSYTVKFDGKEYECLHVGNNYDPIDNQLTPYSTLNVSKSLNKELPENWRNALVWFDTGKVKQIFCEYETTFTSPEVDEISADMLQSKADEIASKYIDTDKCETIVNLEKLKVTYQQKFGELYLEDPFYIEFVLTNEVGLLPVIINFGRTGMFEMLEYDPEAVKSAINKKLSHILFDYVCELVEIELASIGVAKFGVPVVISNVEVKSYLKNAPIYLTFYTKISD